MEKQTALAIIFALFAVLAGTGAHASDKPPQQDSQLISVPANLQMAAPDTFPAYSFENFSENQSLTYSSRHVYQTDTLSVDVLIENLLGLNSFTTVTGEEPYSLALRENRTRHKPRTLQTKWSYATNGPANPQPVRVSLFRLALTA